ncbi:hypothetical protein CFN78_25880 [Amycolatopsis antarctica]|uniref:Uncharacterized protein n=1 Tax=Amycolatopsis antarctica TaxID=1854586 RepID=A0A263CW51_9PSEU|nr:hypothetical protein [Amycolatopsis antarctica]OZM70353.1 hypothetical protein CFN78_25880 [Amycolatopsis antarctica]
MTTLFDVAEDTRFGVLPALRWQAENVGHGWQWVRDRELTPPGHLVEGYQLVHRGLAELGEVFDETDGSGIDSGFPKSVAERLSADVLDHPHGRSMVPDRAPIRLVGLRSLLCPLYVNDTRELFLPGWLTPEIVSNLFSPNASFTSRRPTCTTWLVLDAPVYRERGKDFATFAYFFTREGTDPGARWHWRANDGRD